MGAEVPSKTGGGTKGRNDGASGGDGKTGANVAMAQYTSRQGSVVIHATVEHIGMVGDTEMTVHVKWPASSFCGPCRDETPSSGGQDADAAVVPDNGPGAYILKASGPDDSTSAEYETRQGTDSSGHTEDPIGSPSQGGTYAAVTAPGGLVATTKEKPQPH
jgi:hypothetical protein